jgi:hypothetical protein
MPGRGDLRNRIAILIPRSPRRVEITAPFPPELTHQYQASMSTTS